MTVEEYKNQFDQSFDSNVFIAKVNNLVVKYFNSITMRDIDKYDHFFADKMFNLAKSIIDINEKAGRIRMFDELNIRSSNIQSIEYKNNTFYANVAMQVLYMDYYIDEHSGNVVEGNNNNRIAHNYTMVFSKERTAKEQIYVKTCPTCGASLNPNDNGICQYCHTVYNQEDHDWVLEDIIGFQ